MSAVLFALPFEGRCLSPSPERKPRRLELYASVVWSLDGEEGVIVGLTPESVTVSWDFSGCAVYARCSLAVRENIIVLQDDDEEEGDEE